MNKAYIFDMDGVLIDSEVIYLKSLVKYLKTLDVDASVKELSIVTGMKLEAITKHLQTQYHLEHVCAEEMMRMQDIYFDQEVELEPLQCMDGLIEFLERLKAKGKKIALASSSDEVWIQQVVDTLEIRKYFDIIVNGDDVTYSKPNPEIFHLAAKRLGCHANECIVIEDSVNGIEAGLQAGMYVVGYKGSQIQQDTSKANIEINSFEEIEIV